VIPEGESEPRVVAAAETAGKEFAQHFEALDFSRALESLWTFVAVVDGYITEKAPWKLKDPASRPALATILYTCAEALRIITALAYPILPDATSRIWAQLGLGEIAHADLKDVRWGQLAAGTKLGPSGPIFPRAEKDTVKRMQDLETNNTSKTPEAKAAPTPEKQAAAVAVAQVSESVAAKGPAALTPAASVGTVPQAAPAKPGTITIDDFAKVELRVGLVQVAERVKGADRLLRLEVNIGDEVRQIVSGIAEAYEPESLVGRKVVIVANLAPRKLRGLESNGMIVAASLGEKGRPVLAGFLEDVEIGARLK
jgi:methionyl-tRNA synthetase